jgi:hypothetical protein
VTGERASGNPTKLGRSNGAFIVTCLEVPRI